MDLEKIAVNIRPRTPWEAIDVGFILARRCYWKLWLLWILASTPFLIVFTGLSLLLPGSTPKWALLFFWFFKPIYEPSLLFWISRDLFGSKNSIKYSISELRQKLTLKRIRTILFNRFSPFRSFSLPVLLLEGLEGKESKNRRSLLRDGSETSVILTVVGFCIEAMMTISLMSVLYWLIPEELRWVDLGDFIFLPDNWLLLISYVASSAVFAPFYICSGFMMYISRRVELEAWDIEIGFKRVQQRLHKRKNGFVQMASALILLCSISLFCLPDRSWSIPLSPETARDTITTVLEEKEFGETIKRQRWVLKEKDIPDFDSPWGDFWQQIFDSLGEFFDTLTPLLAKYGEFLLWCCAGIFIAFLLLKHSSLRQWLGSTFSSADNSYAPPEIMFGMDLRPESLPDDIGKVCTELLRIGKKREAMSLLYRGTLSNLVNNYHLEIHSSFTENECCDEVQQNRPTPEATFFNSLTSLWVFIAYRHRDPNTRVCSELLSRWVNLYGNQS